MSDSTLLHLFAEDIDAATRLLQLIDEEFQALEERDLPFLQQLLETKQLLIQQLEQNGQVRAEILHAAGYPSDHKGWSQYTQGHADQAELLARGEKLADLLGRCQQANLRNGQIIHVNKTSTTSLLNILCGQDTPSLYNSRGGTVSPNCQRPLSQV